MSVRSVLATGLTIVGIVVGAGLILIGLGLAYPSNTAPDDSIGQGIAQSFGWPLTLIGILVLTITVIATVRARRSARRRR